MPRSANFFLSAPRVYRSASFKLNHPKIAIGSWAVAPFSAATVAAAFRSPWAVHCRNPASLHLSRNQLPNPASVNGLPWSLTRNVSSRTCVDHLLKLWQNRKLKRDRFASPILLLREPQFTGMYMLSPE